jgi:hypothetical protein
MRNAERARAGVARGRRPDGRRAEEGPSRSALGALLAVPTRRHPQGLRVPQHPGAAGPRRVREPPCLRGIHGS